MILKLGWLLTSGLVAGLSSLPPAFADSIPRPIVTSDRRIVIASAAEAIPLHIDALGGNAAYLFATAGEACHIDPERVAANLNDLLRTPSLWATLDRIFPGSEARAKALGVRLLIDDFSGFPGGATQFSSYYLSSSTPTIGLDCSEFARSYWLPSLTHEWVHAFFAGTGTASFWEEGIARLLEDESGGVQPSLSVTDFRARFDSTGEFHGLLSVDRPFRSRDAYPMNYLLLTYIRAHFGGWEVLAAMSARDPKCPMSRDFLATAACRGVRFLLENPSHPSEFKTDIMTRAGLLRYFYASLALGNAADTRFQVPGWAPLKQIPKVPPRKNLAPGSAIVFQDRTWALKINQSLETYRFLIYPDDRFQIFRAGSKGWLDPAPANDQDYFLVVNTTLTEQPLRAQTF